MFIRTFFFYTAKKLLFISSVAKDGEIFGKNVDFSHHHND